MSSSAATRSAAASPPTFVTESRTPFTFKLDHIKRLDATTNYLSWHNQVSIYLHMMDIYKYVDGSTHKPTDTTHLATWTGNDYNAEAAIMSFLSEDFSDLASDVPTDKDTWKAVDDHRDLRNSSTIHHTVQSFFSTKMQDTDVLTDYISCYEQKNTYTTERCRSVNNQSVYRHLLAYLKSDETKARHLLMSLPSSMNNSVDNLQSKDSLTYVDIRSRLLELSGSSNLSSNGTALDTRFYKVNKFTNKKTNSEKPNPTRSGKTEPPKGNQCSYCKKYNHPYERHTHKFCNPLKSARDHSASSAPPPAPSRDVVPYRANLTVNEQYDHTVALFTSSLTHPVPTIRSVSAFKPLMITHTRYGYLTQEPLAISPLTSPIF